MNWYEEKQERKRERLEARAERLKTLAEGRIKSGMDRLRAIPFGQPILVGHHSEKRDRNYRRKAGNSIDKGMELNKLAGEVAARAASVGTGGISSDDPDAVKKLKLELLAVETAHEQMAAVNAAWRKAGKPKADNAEAWATIASTSGLAIETVTAARLSMARDFLFRAPYPPYALTNNGANIRRIKGRIEELLKASTRETKETLHNSGVRVVENAEINRVQLFFPGKPAAEVRTMLKRYGFRWSPSEGAWQRHLNGSGVSAAQLVLEKITETGGANV